MKRLLLTLILCISCFLADAQIQRTFFGCTLGSTTWNEAKSIVKQKGIDIIESDKHKGTLMIGDFTFAGYHCRQASMYFHNGFFCQMFFVIKYDELDSEEAYNDLKTKLKDKYSSYLVSEYEDKIILSDDIIGVNLSHSNSTSDGRPLTALLYLDMNLCSQKMQSAEDEL